MTEKSIELMQRRAEVLTEIIKPILAGESPFVQGLVLAELLALWLAGHSRDLRPALVEAHIKAVGELTALQARMLRPDEPPRADNDTGW